MIRSLDLSRRWILGVVTAAALAVYGNSLLNGFAYDDVAVIHDDPRVHGLGHLLAILSKPYWVNFGPELGLYRPVTTLAFALQWTAGGGAPWVFHLVNIALHAAVCVLLFFLLERLTGRAGAFLGALVFALHPVHTEAVANVVGQAEILAALGVLTAALLWLRRPAGTGPTGRTMCALGLAYALSVASKESAIVLPALLVVLDLAQRRVDFTRPGLRAYVRVVAPTIALLAGVAALFLFLRWRVLGTVTGSDVAPSMPFLVHDHFWLGLRAWQEYMRLLVFPQDLSASYSPAVILPVHGWTVETLLGAVLLAGCAGLAGLTAVRAGAGLPAAWLLTTILTVSNLFFPVGVVLAERTLYLPSAAVSIALAYAWAPLRARFPLPLLAAAAASVSLALGLRTFLRNPDWKDQTAVFTAMVRDHPEGYVGHWSLANMAMARGNKALAGREYATALRLWPNDSHLLLDAASYEMIRNRPLPAIALLQRARAIHPGEIRIEDTYAAALLVAGRYRDALVAADGLRAAGGNPAEVAEIQARALMGLGDYSAAADHWRYVLSHSRGKSVEWAGLSDSLAHLGRFGEALAALDSAALRASRDTVTLHWIHGLRDRTVREQATSPTGAPVP